MTPGTLKRILEMAERATPGPWSVSRGHEGYDIAGARETVVVDDGGMTGLDAAFIAAIRQPVADLIRLALAAHELDGVRDSRVAARFEREYRAALAAVFGEGDGHAG
jgi:hypothetical protein